MMQVEKKSIETFVSSSQKVDKLLQQFRDHQRSKTHLSDPNFEGFVRFCQKHDQIVKRFGSSKVCKKNSLACSDECEKHKQDLKNHAFVDMKAFFEVVRKMKNHYKNYHKTYMENVLPKFLNELQQTILKFIITLESWLIQSSSTTYLLPEFLHQTSNREIFSLIQSLPEDWQLSNLTCKDISQMFYLSQRIDQLDPKQMEQGIKNHLRIMLEKVLGVGGFVMGDRIHKLEEEFEKGVQESTKKIREMGKKVDRYGEVNADILSNLTIKLNIENPRSIPAITNASYQKIAETVQASQNQDSNSAINLTAQEKENQLNNKLAMFILQLQQYLKKCVHKTVRLLLKEMGSGDEQFWEYLFENLVNLIKCQQIRGGFSQFVIIVKQWKQISEMFAEFVKREWEEVVYGMLQKEPKNETEGEEKMVTMKIKNVRIVFKLLEKDDKTMRYKL